MAVHKTRSDRMVIPPDRFFACPLCGQQVHSLRILRITRGRVAAGEFYHSTATCAGSLEPGHATSDLLRLAAEMEISFAP